MVSRLFMPQYGRSTGKDVERAVHKYKRGQLHSGKGRARVKSRRQAIAIGLSKARRKGKKVPPPPLRQRSSS